jgi:Fur family ferric uptake transcriptional regulator
VRHILLRWLAPTYLVSEILSELHDFRSASGIRPVLRERGGSVGLATADQYLVLLETGDVDVLTRDDGEAVYFRCSRQHHHHLVCRSCGYAIEITGPAAKRWADVLAERHGYADISHTLVVFGVLSGLLDSVSRYALTPVVEPA